MKPSAILPLSGASPVQAALSLSQSSAPAFIAATLLVLLCACSSKPAVPDWQMNAQGSTQKALDAYLSGNTRVEQLEWDRARAEVARTGRPDLLARLELMRCAAQVAALVPGPCEPFEALRADASAPEKAYADYLAGHIQPQQIGLLPEAQRKVAASGDGASLAAVEDPLSRLVAAGVLFRSGRATPAVIGSATDAASAQGWGRALRAWLTLQVQRAEAAGEQEAAAALRRRIAIVEKSAPALP